MSRGHSRLSIPTRIFLGFALVLAAFGAVSATSLAQHERTASSLRRLHDGYLPLAFAVGQAKATQSVLLTFLDGLMGDRDPTAAQRWLTLAQRGRPGILDRAIHQLDRIERLGPPPEERAALAELRESFDRVAILYQEGEARYDELFEALLEGDQRRAEQVHRELGTHERAIEAELSRARRAVRERVAAVSAQASEQERQAAVLLGALTVLGLLVGVAVIGWAHRMLSPLPRLQQRVAAVARGDLSRRLDPKTDDELGRLAAEFERMVDALAARDARLREAAEEQLRLQRMQQRIVADLGAAVVVIDAKDTVRTANPAAGVVLDLDEGVVGSTLGESGLFEKLPRLGKAVREVADGAERATLAAERFEASRDRAVNVLVTPFAPGDEEDEGRSILIVAEDVTEELRTKARLIQTERLAAIGRMAAHVTHEVRNPLSSIGLNVEMLEDELADAGSEVIALLRAIQREIDRLTGVTEEYLRLARLPQPRLRPEEIGDLVESVARFLRPEMSEAGIRLDVEAQGGLPLVAMDQAQIRQALLNLLRNAREAMPKGGRVSVALAAARGGVRLRIHDQGRGMPEQERLRIFDLFYTTKEQGTGLGLPLTQQIVVANGGLITCESVPGEGATFDLWFPAARPTTPPEVPEPAHDTI